MWELFQSGGPVMWPLLLCSITALTVVLERAWFWRSFNVEHDRKAAEKLLNECRDKEDACLSEIGLKHPEAGGAVTRMLLCGLVQSRFSMTKAMEAAALLEVQRMRRGMGILDTIITAAPMLGILGTVTGIISSFDMLAQSGTDDPHAVIGGIAQALITTAAGLIISIGALFPFNYFNSRIESAQDILESYATRLEMLQDKVECKQQ